MADLSRLNPQTTSVRPAATGSRVAPGDWFFFQQRPDLTFEQPDPCLETLTGVLLEVWQTKPQTLWERVHEDDAAQLKTQIDQCVRSCGNITTIFRLRHAETGRLRWIREFRRAVLSGTGTVAGYEGLWVDVTSEAALERRMTSLLGQANLGALSRGFAHDLNNLLAGVLSMSDLFVTQADEQHPFRDGLNLIKKNARQASVLAGKFVQLFQARAGSRRYHDLNELSRENADLLRKSIPSRIELAGVFPKDVIPVYADDVQFRHAVVSLVLNAVEAMPEKGRLVLKTSAHATGPNLGRNYWGDLAAGPCACLTVQDEGRGMESADLPFGREPGITTQPANNGAGLGLALVRRFVGEHHGALSIESIAGRGTTVRLWLPSAAFTEAEQGASEQSRRAPAVFLVGSPSDSFWRVAAVMEHNNCRVIPCSRDAERTLLANDEPLSALFVRQKNADSAVWSLIRTMRRLKRCPVIILQTAQSEVEVSADNQANLDLILPWEVPEIMLAQQVTTLLADRSERNQQFI